MTLVNLASLAMMLFVLFSARGRADLNFDPTDPRQLIYAESNINHDTSDEFQDAVVYLPRGVSQLVYFSCLFTDSTTFSEPQI